MEYHKFLTVGSRGAERPGLYGRRAVRRSGGRNKPRRFPLWPSYDATTTMGNLRRRYEEASSLRGNGSRWEGSTNLPPQAEDVTTPDRSLVTPSELVDFMINGQARTQHRWIDSAAIGDVLGGSCDVFLCPRNPLTLAAVGYAAGMTLAAKYLGMGEEAAAGPPGAMRWYASPYSVEIAQAIADPGKTRRYRQSIRNSQLDAQSLHDVWQQEAYLPAKASTRTHRLSPNRSCCLAVGDGWKRCRV